MFDGIDKFVFGISSIVVLIFVIWIAGFTESAGTALSVMLNYAMANISWVYMLTMLLMFGFCLFLCFSKWGKIRLGKDDEKPKYGTVSWLAMMFSAAMGVGLIFYGVSEPVTMWANPPSTEGLTALGALEGMKQTFFNNGMSMWSCYCLFGLGLAYFNFRKGRPALLSYMLEPLIGRKRVEGRLGQVVDSAAIISTVFGIAAALSICAQQLSAGFEMNFGLPATNMVINVTIAVICAMYLCSAISGVDKGIKFLSNANVVLATILMFYLLLVGPTAWLMEFFMQSLGEHIFEFIPMSFNLDAFGLIEANAGYDLVGEYPVMYVAWFLAWTCFVGAFVAKVSRGRTIREVVWGVLIIPGLVSYLWFVALGGNAIYLELFGGIELSPSILKSAQMALFLLLDYMPGGSIMSIVTIVLIVTFFITTADSSTFIASVYCSRGTDSEPKVWVKLYWGIMIAVIAIIFWPIGGVQVCRQLSLIIAIPITIAAWALIASLIKSFKAEKNTLAQLDQV
ncbi:BCCT family transporter [Anaerotruncus rubiinfantis]|uniref:BCCT family transporter n=1 Tax=Anaerotruncus rubiinfantis TaxID=1720200 RepID=UPI001FA726A0|nr:BCCT family transporter [Anaerotruncus rubiinfantis]